jgi:hypothetical protein
LAFILRTLSFDQPQVKVDAWRGDPQNLEDTDTIVSSDLGFMKRAFEQLWLPKGKRMLTPEEFSDELREGIQWMIDLLNKHSGN